MLSVVSLGLQLWYQTGMRFSHSPPPPAEHARTPCRRLHLTLLNALVSDTVHAIMSETAVSFRTYRDAHASLGIPGSYMVGTLGTGKSGVRSLKLTCHDGSRDELLEGGQRIMYAFGLLQQQNVTCFAGMWGGASSQAQPIQLQTSFCQTRNSSALLQRLVRLLRVSLGTFVSCFVCRDSVSGTA